jgi:hypothetical protein
LGSVARLSLPVSANRTELGATSFLNRLRVWARLGDRKSDLFLKRLTKPGNASLLLAPSMSLRGINRKRDASCYQSETGFVSGS